MDIKKIIVLSLLLSILVFSGCVKMLQGLDKENTVDRERFYGTWEGNLFRPANAYAILVDSVQSVKFTFFPDGTYATKSYAIHHWNIFGNKIVLTANGTDVVFTFYFSENDTQLVFDSSSGVISLTRTRIWMG